MLELERTLFADYTTIKEEYSARLTQNLGHGRQIPILNKWSMLISGPRINPIRKLPRHNILCPRPRNLLEYTHRWQNSKFSELT